MNFLSYMSEFMHRLAVFLLGHLPGCCLKNFSEHKPYFCMRLQFPNRIGLAAGWDKQAQALKGLEKLGFGFVEVGGVTPNPQVGNAKPRVFRLSSHQAIINRYGLNSHGACKVSARLRRYKNRKMPVGVNIAPNTDSPQVDWISDYQLLLKSFYDCADYFAVNVSCPNTGHADAQGELEFIETVLQTLGRYSLVLADEKHVTPKPLLIKIAPGLPEETLRALADKVCASSFAGIIASNTTSSRESVADHEHAGQTGGLSGPMLLADTIRTIRVLRQASSEGMVLIASGGISKVEDLQAVMEAGADLFQIYTAFIYQGPKILTKLSKT